MVSFKELIPIYGKLLLKRKAGTFALPQFSGLSAAIQPRLSPESLQQWQRLLRLGSDDHIPATLPYVIGFPTLLALFGSKAFPLPALGLVHKNFRFSWPKPLRLRDLDHSKLSVRIQPLRPHHRGHRIPVTMTLENAQEVLWESELEFLSLSRKAGKRREPPQEGEGEWLPLGTECFPFQSLWRYALLSRDLNPIHLTHLSAKILGQKSAIAHGMWVLARAISHAQSAFPTKRLAAMTVEFLSPVPVPGAVSIAYQGLQADGGGLIKVHDLVKNRNHLRGKVCWA